jgi:hypothetical protein
VDRTEAQQGAVKQPSTSISENTTMKTKTILAAALLAGWAFTTVRAAVVTPAEARVIAKEAYIYGEPIVDNYRVQYAYFVDTKSPEYKALWNHIWNSARLFSPADKAIQTANSDTLYSMIGADLRAEPIVLAIPKIKRSAISPSSSSTTTRRTSTTSVVARPATMGGPTCSPDPAGKVRHPRASTRSFDRRLSWRFPGIARSSSIRVISRM